MASSFKEALEVAGKSVEDFGGAILSGAEARARALYGEGKAFREIWKDLKASGLSTAEAKRVAKEQSPSADHKKALRGS